MHTDELKAQCPVHTSAGSCVHTHSSLARTRAHRHTSLRNLLPGRPALPARGACWPPAPSSILPASPSLVPPYPSHLLILLLDSRRPRGSCGRGEMDGPGKGAEGPASDAARGRSAGPPGPLSGLGGCGSCHAVSSLACKDPLQSAWVRTEGTPAADPVPAPSWGAEEFHQPPWSDFPSPKPRHLFPCPCTWPVCPGCRKPCRARPLPQPDSP